MINKKAKKWNLSNKQKQVLLVILIPVLVSLLLIFLNSKNDGYTNDGEYNSLEYKEMFLNDAKYIEIKLSNLILDGSVTNQATLDKKVNTINKILKGKSWDNLDMKYIGRWDGNWYLDNNGMVKFKFSSGNIEPKWIQNSDISVYIVKN